jgi:hypothetical protein
MQTNISQNPLHQHCLGKLNQILDLAMHTAEAASAEGNHRIVLQAVREVTRIITLMNKLDSPPKQESKTKPHRDQDSVTATPTVPRHALPEIGSADLDLLQETLLNLALPPTVQLKTGSSERETEKRLFQKREKGGK